MTWIITGEQVNPAVIGEPFGGGYFAGYISHTADGNATHALIVAPRETGATGTGYTLTSNLANKTTQTFTADSSSSFDGKANTDAMIAAGITDHPAAEFCVNLSIGGFTDWYLPAKFELDIAYFNLKPTTEVNNTLFGVNVYSVPQRTSTNTVSYPAQTNLADFTSSIEQFAANPHWSSTQTSPGGAASISFANGSQNNSDKRGTQRVRAFRRIAL